MTQLMMCGAARSETGRRGRGDLLTAPGRRRSSRVRCVSVRDNVSAVMADVESGDPQTGWLPALPAF